MKGALIFLLLLVAWPALAQQPQPQPQQSSPPDPIVTAYQLGLRTGQEVANAMSVADERLKQVQAWWDTCIRDSSCVKWVISAGSTSAQ